LQIEKTIKNFRGDFISQKFPLDQFTNIVATKRANTGYQFEGLFKKVLYFFIYLSP